MPKLHFFTQADNQPPTTKKELKKPKTNKEKYRLTNWPAYNKGLIQSGFVTIWLDQTTLDQWYYQGPRTAGGLFCYSEQASRLCLAQSGLSTRFAPNTGADSESLRGNEDRITSAFLYATAPAARFVADKLELRHLSHQRHPASPPVNRSILSSIARG